MLNKLYNKHLDIITQNDNVIHIERKKILIHESPILYGEASIIRKNNSVYLIKEVYSFEDNRLRYSYDVYDNVKAYDTVEKKEDGKEEEIYVIESYEKKDTLIGSIGNIKKIDSDKTLLINNEKSLILKLLRKNKDEKNSIEDLIAA